MLHNQFAAPNLDGVQAGSLGGENLVTLAVGTETHSHMESHPRHLRSSNGFALSGSQP